MKKLFLATLLVLCCTGMSQAAEPILMYEWEHIDQVTTSTLLTARTVCVKVDHGKTKDPMLGTILLMATKNTDLSGGFVLLRAWMVPHFRHEKAVWWFLITENPGCVRLQEEMAAEQP